MELTNARGLQMIAKWKCECGQENWSNVYSAGTTTAKCVKCFADYALTTKIVMVQLMGGRTEKGS